MGMQKNSPLSTKLKVVMPYQATFNLNPGIGTIGVHVFSLNSLYDPDVTGIGHQPRGFDQLVGVLYDHYVVILTAIQVDFHNTDTTQAQIVSVTVKDNVTLESTMNDYMESGRTSYSVVSGANSGKAMARIRMTINPNKFLGRSHPLSDPQLKGSASGSPLEGCYFHIAAGPVDGTVDGSPIQCNVMLVYTAILIEPRTPGIS